MSDIARCGLLVVTAEQEIEKIHEYEAENELLIKKYKTFYGLYARLMASEEDRLDRLLEVEKNFGGKPPTRETEMRMQIGSLIDESEERLYNLIEECDKYTRYLFGVFDNKDHYKKSLENNSNEAFYARCYQHMAQRKQEAEREFLPRPKRFWSMDMLMRSRILNSGEPTKN